MSQQKTKKKNRFIPLIPTAIAIALAVGTAQTASADPVTWTLDNVVFNDGATADGSFVYEADTNLYSNINIVITNPDTSTDIFGFVNPSSSGNSTFVSIVASSLPDLTGQSSAYFQFTSALTNAGGQLDIIPWPEGFSVRGICVVPNCESFGAISFLVSGGIVAEFLVTNTTQGTQHQTLQDALNNAASGNAITIAAGTLFEDNITFPNGLDVTITGAGMDQTFIDGGNGTPDAPILRMVNTSQTAATIISNLTFQNGVATPFSAGGVRITGIDAGFTNIRFLNNSNNGGNANLLVNSSTSRFDQCEFIGGQGARSVGVTGTSTASFVQCLFAEPQAFRAIEALSDATARMDSCTISGFGRAIEVAATGIAIVTNCVMDGDVVGSGTIATAHSLYSGAPASNGNIDGSPTFVDAANGDYRLAVGSLGIDAGDYDAYITAGGGAFDLDGSWRRIDGAPTDTGVGAFSYLDMGAYETSSLVTDCNTNGIEDSVDLATTGAFTDFQSAAGHAFTLNSNGATNPVVDNGSIRLTEGGVQGQLASAIFDPQLADTVANFRVSFDVFFIAGTGTGLGVNDEGISFALLDKQVHGTSALFSEMGPASGALVVRIREFRTLEVALDGVVLASVSIADNTQVGNWHHLDVEFVNGVVGVILTPFGGQPLPLISVAAVFTPFEALYGFGSRTDATTNEQRIDNVRFESLRPNDCDTNGTPDQCDPDANGDGTPDACQCLGDLDGDGTVGFGDLLSVLVAWGSDDPVADLDGNGMVGFEDLLILLSAWGPCP